MDTAKNQTELTMTEFLEITGVHMRLPEKIPFRPDQDSTDWPKATHWKVVLWTTHPRKWWRSTFPLYSSKGPGHHGEPPDLPEILDCLVNDADILYYDNFEHWADDYGYDSDSRKAEQTFKQRRKQARAFRAFLGEEYLQMLCDDVEGL